jgi:threonine dehydrogenase-like Zn-dependent dehydrogenase
MWASGNLCYYLRFDHGQDCLIDSVPECLAEAEKFGAKVINLNNNLVPKIKAATEGRGANVVMEVVGQADALLFALDLTRPLGQISSIGVHTEKDRNERTDVVR